MGGVPLFWKLSHRHIERCAKVEIFFFAVYLSFYSELSGLLMSINGPLSSASFVNMLNTSQALMMHLEKHGQFEDEFLLPRIACAVPTIAEAS